MFYIYIILNTSNYKIYVGQTQDLQHRWSSHKCEANADRLHYPLYKALRKYGFDNFRVSVVEVLKTAEQADLAETYWIQYFDSRSDAGYNLMPGGKVPRGWHHTEKHKQFISNLFRGRQLAPPITEETRQKLSDVKMGHLVSEETRKKISKSNENKTASSETKSKMSLAKIGSKLTDAHKGEISKGLIEFQKTNTKTSNLAKLAFNIVEQIRSEWNSGNFSQRELAQKYDVHRMTIMRIVNNQTRKRS